MKSLARHKKLINTLALNNYTIVSCANNKVNFLKKHFVWSRQMSKKQKKLELQSEVRESLEHKLVLRREAPLIGLVSFIVALWGSKLVTGLSPGTGIIFQLWGYNIHLHHFNFGLLFIVIALMLTFFEGAWFVRIQHVLFGAGLGFVIDEYWLLLTFDESASVYFGPQSQFMSQMLGVIITVAYAAIAIGVFFASRREIRLWRELYERIKSGKVRFPE